MSHCVGMAKETGLVNISRKRLSAQLDRERKNSRSLSGGGDP